MKVSRIKAKLRRGEPVLVTQLHLTDPVVHELVSLLGFDGIWLDLEHHPTGVETAAGLMRAARVGTSDIIARPGKGEFMRLGRLLDAGAQGIMYPRCDDAREAAEVVRWSKFAPLGQRGFDGAGPDAPYCALPMDQYVRQANEETFVIIQLEEQRALDEAAKIAALDGVDALMFGPADFSVLSGVPGQFDHPRVQAAVQQVAKAARAAGKAWGMPAFNVEHAKQLLDLGAQLLFHAADIVLLRNGFLDVQRRFAPLGFRFGPAPEREHAHAGK
jgi:4-hydroxy-2-oxoheptanedioate aldolase